MSTSHIGIPTGEEGLVGRARELEGIEAAMAASARMVTLVGPGGIGKTRLAAVTAARLRKAGGMPVFWVHLARLPQGSGATAVAEEMVASVLDGDFSSRSGLQALVDALGGVGVGGAPVGAVLVLDNCEHVLEGVGDVVAQLLSVLPGLVVLATSRSAIGWVDEQIVMVPPLAREQAVALFCQRAELAGRVVGAGDLDVVGSICEHLSFFPLHIRLAAARLRYQSLAMVLADLAGSGDRRLRWSPGFRVGVDDRHRDISAVIGWSYELCGESERLLFERLSVFAAGYDVNPDDVDADRGVLVAEVGADLEAIVAVCGDAGVGGPGRGEIEGCLEQLVDRSLVILHVGVGAVRYSLLESFRVFALERLMERSPVEHEVLVGRHLGVYRDRVAELCSGWVSAREQELLGRARADWDNVAVAIAGSASKPDRAVVGARMAVDLISSRLPFLRGSLREFRRLAQDSLRSAQSYGQCPPELGVSTDAWIGWLSACQGLPEDAEQRLERCAAVACTALPADWRADPAIDRGLPPEVDYLWGSMLLLVYGDPRATQLLNRARIKLTGAGIHGGAAMAGLFEALSAGFFGSAEEALRVTREHLDDTVSAGAEWAISHAQFARAIALSAHGGADEARALCEAGLTRQIPMQDQWCCVWGVHIRSWSLAQMILESGSEIPQETLNRWAVDIARVSGSIEPVRRHIGLDVLNLKPFAERTLHAIATARQVLASKAFDAAAREGEQMPTVVALAAALLSTPEPATAKPVAGADGSAWTELTGAEQEVAVLAAAGLTNATIAARRGTSTRTADAQLASILSKLMINSRKDIRALLPAAARERATEESQRRSTRHG